MKYSAMAYRNKEDGMKKAERTAVTVFRLKEAFTNLKATFGDSRYADVLFTIKLGPLHTKVVSWLHADVLW